VQSTDQSSITQSLTRSDVWVQNPVTLGAVALALVYVFVWSLATPYFGFNHDAQAYAAAALLKIDPQVFAQELFFRYRSQEELSAFPSIYAWAIRVLGLEPAAAVLCASFQLAWFTLVGAIAIRLLGRRLGFLALGLLVALPLPYGGQRVFHLVEPFLTARLPAEVLSLLAFWLYLRSYRAWSLLAVTAALAVHPLIAFPALLLLGLVEVRRRFEFPKATAAAALAVVLGAVGGAWLLGGTTPVMEGQWLAVTKIRSAFLFADGWRAGDWSNVAMCLLLLHLMARAPAAGEGSRVAAASAWLAVAGLVLTAVTTWITPLTVLVEGQPWRWMWPARLFATMMLPGLLSTLWVHGPIGRVSAMFTGAGCFLFVGHATTSPAVQWSPALLVALGSLSWALRDRLDGNSPALLGAARAVLAFVLLAGILRAMAALRVGMAGPTGDWFGALRAIGSATLPLVLIVALAWAVVSRTVSSRVHATTLAVACALFAIVVPRAWAEWTEQRFGALARDSFADWRAIIPPDAEVLWLGDRLKETWFLVGRRSYLSRSHSGGVVFSPELAAEVVRRALVLEPITRPGYWIAEPGAVDPNEHPLTATSLREICRDPELGFVIADVEIARPAARKGGAATGGPLLLYSCKDAREMPRP
jgi:hypothetical protein